MRQCPFWMFANIDFDKKQRHGSTYSKQPALNGNLFGPCTTPSPVLKHYQISHFQELHVSASAQIVLDGKFAVIYDIRYFELDIDDNCIFMYYALYNLVVPGSSG